MSSRVPSTRPGRPMAGCAGRLASPRSINSSATLAAAAGLSCPMYFAISSRSRSACFVQRTRKFLLPLRLQARVVDESPAVGVAQAFLYGRDLPFVELDELPHRFGGERGAAPIGRLGQLVEALSDVRIQPERHGFSHHTSL